MTIRVAMKTPDALIRAIDEAVEDAEFGDDEEGAAEMRSTLLKIGERWIRYGEYATLEIDTDAGTCVVVQA